MRRQLTRGEESRRQAGFSMIEMLMAAFILAIGILGLTALQTMSVKAATGSRGLNTAVLVAERVMDEIEANGRNCLLYVQSAVPGDPVTAHLSDVFTSPSRVPPAAPNRTYNFAGRINAADPVDPNPYFSLYIQPDITVGAAHPGVVAPVAGLGGIANMTVVVQWTETAGAAPRQVALSRRVSYATF